jgi:hypothetical protein
MKYINFVIMHVLAVFCFTSSVAAEVPLFDIKEMYDESTLDVKVISDWKAVSNGDAKTRSTKSEGLFQ